MPTNLTRKACSQSLVRAGVLFRHLQGDSGVCPKNDYVGSRYSGRYQFNKHFYPVLADLKDGGEEFLCAQLLDNHAKVKHWVRNLDTAPCGFALATSKGRFFPDFIAELTDGRLAVVEYKGAHLLNDPYEIEKRQIGELWALKSQGRCLFGQIAKQRDGVGMSGQLDALLA